MVMLRCGTNALPRARVHVTPAVVKAIGMYPVQLNQVAAATHMIDQQEIR